MTSYDVRIDYYGDHPTLGGTVLISIAQYVQSVSWSLGASEPLQELADESTLSVVVDNSTGYFSPENGDSPIAPFNPRMKVYVEFLDPEYLLSDDAYYLLDDDGNRLTNNAEEYTSRLATGYIENIKPGWSPTERIIDVSPGTPPAVISCTSRKKFLEGINIGLDLWTNRTADFITFVVLGAVGLVEDALLAVCSQNIPYYGDILSGDAYQMIADVVGAERGFFYFDRSGRAVLWERNHMTAVGTEDFSIVTNDPANLFLPTGLDYEYGQLVSNSVKVTASPRQTFSSETLWTLDSSITILAGQTETFEAILRRTNGEFAGASSVAVGTSTFSAGTATINLTLLGNRVTVELVNSGGVSAVLTALTITGVPIVTQNGIEVVKEDATTIDTYGRRRLELDLQAVSTYADAESIAAYELARRQTPRPVVRSISYVRPVDGVSDYFLNVFQIGHRLNIVSPELFHDADYYIIGEEHTLDTALHTATFYLEPAIMHS